MNDTGLFSGIYEGIRDHADLLDRVLVQLKAGTSTAANDERQRLAAWLMVLDDDHVADYSARMIRPMLRSQRPRLPGGWAEVGESLRAGAVSAALIGRLEELARALEREQAAAMARLRGET
jgi:hypothetical protein